MQTEPRRSRGQQGFTLIEVLMAMLLLGIGVMLMGGLATSAIRSVGLAERNSRAAATATLYLEDALQQLRTGFAPQSCTNQVLANGDKVTRVVTLGNAATPLSQVTVTVVPEPRGRAPRPFTITSNVFHSNQLPTQNGRACPP